MKEISREYAQALFELAREQGGEQEFYSALLDMKKEFDAAPEYVQVLSSPNIPAQERCALLEQAFAGRLPEYVLSFVKLMCEKGHIQTFGDCVKEYEGLYHSFCSVVSVRVVSAVELNDSEKENLVAKLEKANACTVQAQYEVDSSLMGGIIIYMDDKIIDGSLRTKLKELKEVIAT